MSYCTVGLMEPKTPFARMEIAPGGLQALVPIVTRAYGGPRRLVKSDFFVAE